MSDLEIPERALTIACDVYDAALTGDTHTDPNKQVPQECTEKQAVRAAAPIIVAAELRRLAAILWDQGQLGAEQILTQRAEKLNPEKPR